MDGNGKPIKSKMEAMYYPARPKTMCFGEDDFFHVHHTNEFKYLGSRLVPTPSDERDIDIQIQQATMQARQLENFWRTSHDLQVKRALLGHPRQHCPIWM